MGNKRLVLAFGALLALLALLGCPISPAGAELPIATLAVGNGPRRIAVNTQVGRAYVTNGLDNTVAVIATATNTLVATIPTGSGPNGVAANPKTGRVYVSNLNDDSVTVIDGATQQAIDLDPPTPGTQGVPVGNYPKGLAINAQTGRIYVANGFGGTVSVINAATNARVDTYPPTLAIDDIPVGSDPTGVAIDVQGNRVFVANCSSDSISVIDGAMNTRIDTNPALGGIQDIAVGDCPTELAFDPATGRLYVTLFNDDALGIVDGATYARIDTDPAALGTQNLPVGDGPSGVALDPTVGRAYVTNGFAGTLSIIETATLDRIDANPAQAGVQDMPLPGGATGVAPSPVADRVYVTSYSAGTLTVIANAPLPTATAASPATAPYGAGSAVLGATITTPAGVPVDGGKVAFTVRRGATTVRTGEGKVVGGAASATIARGGLAPGSYTVQAAYSGSTDFQSSATSVPATLIIANSAPTALGDTYAATEDTPLAAPVPGVLANDADAEGNPLTVALVTGPAHGALTLDPTGAFTYTPAPDFAGTDTFTYRANDGAADSPPATVTIAVGPVNDAPVAAGTSATTAANTPVAITLAASDGDSAGLTFAVAAVPTHGGINLGEPICQPVGVGASCTATATYTPTPGYVGPDSFAFVAGDGTLLSAPATATIAVTSAPAPTYTILVSITGAGTVSPGTSTYPVGTSASFVATPAVGHLFVGWEVDGRFVGFGDPLQFPVTRDRQVVARFAALPSFCDVTPQTPGYEAIFNLAARGIIRGQDGCFKPGDPTLRAQMAVLIDRAFGFPRPTGPTPFPDRCAPDDPQDCVDVELWGAVGALAAADVARGYTDVPGREVCAAAGLPSPCYLPRESVLTVQTVAFISRAFVAKGYWASATADDPALYPNVPASSGHRLDLITYARNAGPIPTTVGGDLPDFDRPGTRAFFAEALWRAYAAYWGTNRVP
jgi:YVTN family beta-propeller protein/VCBS repeat-containing protein